MAYWTGLALFALAAAFLAGGLRHRAAVRQERVDLGYAARDDTPQRRDPSSTIAILGDAVPPIVLAALGFVGIKSVFFYVALGGGILSVVDLAGFLAFLAGYGSWMWLRSKYRFAAPTPAVARAEGDGPTEDRPERAAPAAADRHAA
jgi:hypothetical protein